MDETPIFDGRYDDKSVKKLRIQTKHSKYEKLSVFLRDRAGLLLYYLLNNPSAYSWKTGLLQKYCRILDSYLLILICNLFNRRYSKRKYVSSSGNNSYLDEEGGGGIRE